MCEMYYPNTVNNSQCGGFQSERIVLPEHVECASSGFSLHLLQFLLNLNKTVSIKFILIKERKVLTIATFFAEIGNKTICLDTSTHHSSLG